MANFMTGDGYTITEMTFNGPSKDISVGATSQATVSLPISDYGGIKYVIAVLGISSIDGLPSGVSVAGFTYDKTNKTLNLTLYNPTGSAVTVSANSVTAKITVVGV